MTPFVGSESGDVVLTGHILVHDDVHNDVVLYGPNLVEATRFASGAISGNPPICRSGDRKGFYVAARTGATTVTLKAVNTSGVVTRTWTLNSTNDVSAIAASPDDTILYLSGKAGSTHSAINRWDLVNSTYLSDFAADIAGYDFDAKGMLCLTDGRVIATYRYSGATPLLVRVYNPAGTVLDVANLWDPVRPSCRLRVG